MGTRRKPRPPPPGLADPGPLFSPPPSRQSSFTRIALSPPLHHCVFEHIYFSRPDSRVFGESVDAVRRRLGRRLAIEHPVEADLVTAVPDSSNSIALGYSEQSGIRYELALIRNHYVGR